MDQKQKTFLKLQKDPNSREKKRRHQENKATLLRETHKLKHQWWVNKAAETQALADKNDTRGFFNATKAIFSPSSQGQVPLQSKDGLTLLKIKDDIRAMWKEHFEELLNTNLAINEDMLSQLPSQNAIDDLSWILSLEETCSAIKALNNNKAPDIDNIPAKVFKEGGPLLQQQLHQLIIKIWI